MTDPTPNRDEQVLRERLAGLAEAMGRAIDREGPPGAVPLPSRGATGSGRPAWVRPLAAAAAAAAVVGGALALAAADDDPPAKVHTLDPRPTTTTTTSPLEDGMTKEQRDFIDRVAANEPQKIVDSKGHFRGTVLPSQMDDLAAAVDARLTLPPATPGGQPRRRQVTAAERDAYGVLEAVEVLDADGRVAGYWSGVFISKHDYPKAVRDAEKLTGERADN